LAHKPKKKPRQVKKPLPQKPKGKQNSIFASLLKKLFGRSTPPQTAQQSIPYQEMYKDGICRVTDKLFNKTVIFNDINYQLGATRSHTNTIPQGLKFCGRLGHVVLKMGGFLQSTEATTYTLMSGMMG
jgi:hypothetical protein